MKMRKAQLSVEFIIVFMIFMVALAALLSSTRLENIVEGRLNVEVNSARDDITNRINTAYLEGDGFSSKLYLPPTIGGYNYTIITAYNTVVLVVNDQAYSSVLITQNITGTLKKGENTIRNSHGIIVIT